MPNGTETVLLVEDDGAVRALAAQVLRDCGYRVLEAAHGRAATTIVEAHTGGWVHLFSSIYPTSRDRADARIRPHAAAKKT